MPCGRVGSVCSRAVGAGSDAALGMVWLYPWAWNDQVSKLCTALSQCGLGQSSYAGQPPASPFAPCSLQLLKTHTCSVFFRVGADRNPCAFGFLFPCLI